MRGHPGLPARMLLFVGLLVGGVVRCLGCDTDQNTPITSETQLQSSLKDSSCDTIWLQAGGTINLTEALSVDRSVVIRSSGSDSVKLDGHLIVSASERVDDFKCQDLRHQRMLRVSGPIQVSFQSLELVNSLAGAVWFDTLAGKSVSFDSVNLLNNGDSHTSGGAMCVSVDPSSSAYKIGHFKMKGCTFTNNTAFIGGGADFSLSEDLAYDTLYFEDVHFIGNHALSEGGGMRIAGTEIDLYLTGCSFTKNWAPEGGGLAARPVTVTNITLDNTVFYQNTASLVGGGLATTSMYMTQLTITNCRFEDNGATNSWLHWSAAHAFGGGAWSARSIPLCDRGCPHEWIRVWNTEFIGNQAPQGAAVYLSAAVETVFNNCTWRNNQGIQPRFSTFHGFTTRGTVSWAAALATTSLSLDVTFNNCLLTGNTAKLSSQVGMRMTIFKGSLTFVNTTVIDEKGLSDSVTSFKWRDLPQINITFVNCDVTGLLDISTSTTVTSVASTFRSIETDDDGDGIEGGVFVNEGGAFIIEKSAPSNLRLQYTAWCNVTNGDVSTAAGAVGVCERAAGPGVLDSVATTGGLYDFTTATALVLADSVGNPINVDESWWRMVSFQMSVEASDYPHINVFLTHKQTRHLETQTLQDDLRFNYLSIDPDQAPFQCSETSVELTCPVAGNNSGLPSWARIVIPVLAGVVLLLMLARAFFVYREWSVPGVGLVGCPIGCALYRIFDFSCFFRNKRHRQTFTEDPLSRSSADEHDQVLEMNLLGATTRESVESAIEEIESAWETITPVSVVDSLIYFGYGLIDFKRDLCMKGVLGMGNFGTVRLAVLRRRGLQPARLVAVKELLAEGEQSDLIEEARLMQDIPPHPNVVFLFGVTELPMCLVSQLIEDACELQDHIANIAKMLSSEDLLQSTLRLLLDACIGLAHLHEHGIVHCDIAPRNVLVANTRSDTARPRAMINDFGLARRLTESDHVEFSGKYDRYLASPENYGMVGHHGLPSDVFMMAITIWECIALHWDLFEIFFNEGSGLVGLDVRQITKPADPINVTEEKRGVLVLFEAVHSCQTLPNKGELSSQVCRLVCEGLQHDPESRPTMEGMVARVKECWKCCLDRTAFPENYLVPVGRLSKGSKVAIGRRKSGGSRRSSADLLERRSSADLSEREMVPESPHGVLAPKSDEYYLV